MLINEIANPLGAAGAFAGGVAKQLGRNIVQNVTGKNPDELSQRTPSVADVFRMPTALPDLSPEPESATNIAKTDRLRVSNPQKNATFYKYSDMKWYDEFGNMMPKNSWDQLEKWADDPALGYYEKNYKVSGFRRKNKKGSSV
jgi:hypothetical protein